MIYSSLRGKPSSHVPSVTRRSEVRYQLIAVVKESEHELRYNVTFLWR